MCTFLPPPSFFKQSCKKNVSLVKCRPSFYRVEILVSRGSDILGQKYLGLLFSLSYVRLSFSVSIYVGKAHKLSVITNEDVRGQTTYIRFPKIHLDEDIGLGTYGLRQTVPTWLFGAFSCQCCFSVQWKDETGDLLQHPTTHLVFVNSKS